ncbi:MAG: PD-(D/E)XK nuclease family protein [Candidatus Bathyarchaeia archaeon]
MSVEIRQRFLRLLREDEEFRYAVAGMIGLDEILRRQEAHDEKFAEIVKRLDAHDQKFIEIIKRLETHDEKFAEIVKRLEVHDQKFGEIIKRLEVHDEKFAEIVKRLDAHEEELVRLRRDMLSGFERMDRHLSALGARWGLMAEEAFREGLRGLIEREFGYKVQKWVKFDEKGLVLGYPSQIEVDVAVSDEKTILVEIKSQTTASDVYMLKRKAEFYQKIEKRKPHKLIIVTPYAEEKALEAAKHLGIEIYTKV